MSNALRMYVSYSRCVLIQSVYTLGFVGHAAEQHQGRQCYMGVYVEVAGPATTLCKLYDKMLHTFCSCLCG